MRISDGSTGVCSSDLSYPDRVFAALPFATAARHTAQNIAFHEVGRQAIMADPDWRNGEYTRHGVKPERGLAVARMAAHITYLSEQALHRKFGRNLQNRTHLIYDFREAECPLESYLRYQRRAFVGRCEANSSRYTHRAMESFSHATDNDTHQ